MKVMLGLLACAVCTAFADVAPDAFFTVRKKDDGRWTLVDPEGRDFYLRGVDHCKFDGFKDAGDGRFRYREANVARFGDDRRAWAKDVAGKFSAWRLNTVGINTKPTPELWETGLAHLFFVWYDGFELTGKDLQIPPRFPNVFHPDWPRYCDELARKECVPRRDDRRLVGYFIGNELHWWGGGKGEWHTGLFTSVAEMPDSSFAKKALLAYTGGKTNVEQSVREGFVRLCAERYFSVAAGAIRKYDRNHLVLGCRFMGLDGAATEGVLEVAAKHCDVLSVNIYPAVDLEGGRIWPNWRVRSGRLFHEAMEAKFGRVDKPFLVTEWSILGDRDVLGMCGGESQRRARAAAAFVRAMRDCRFIVGWDWFMWTDAPRGGIDSPGQCTGNWGLVDEAGTPCEPLVNALRETGEPSSKEFCRNR